ncbi:MAG: alpha/beta hydrolase [Ferruginibacter sp.]|nr:alpha/beta hydrolase [Ferruginibacter sp.]
MKTRKFFLLVFTLAVVTISCSKNDTGTGTGGPIAEKNELNVAYGTNPLQKMDIYLPANRSTATTKVIILIHGGGWVSGDKADFTSANLDTIKKRMPGYAIFNINYRLGALPATNTFPTQELDVKAAVEYIYGNRNNYLVSDKFVLMGASAGAHLSLLQAYKYTSPVKIKAVVDFFGPTDMVAMYNDNPGSQLAMAALLNGTPSTNLSLYQQSSPLFFVNAANPPTIILQGGADPLVNATTQSLALKNKLVTAGVTNQYVYYATGGHGDWDVATYTDAYNNIQAFLSANVQ